MFDIDEDFIDIIEFNEELPLVFKELNTFINTKIKTLPKVNQGGCGIVAYLLWKKLRELGFLKISCHATTYKQADATKMLKDFQTIANKEAKPRLGLSVRFHHLVLLVEYEGDNYIVDADGIVKALKNSVLSLEEQVVYKTNYIYYSDYKITEAIPYDVLKKLANFPSFWNSSFDRKVIPELKKEIYSFETNY